MIRLSMSCGRHGDRSAALSTKYFPTNKTLLIETAMLTPFLQLVVVVSSLATNNPSLALANTLGSSIANILGSFSIGLVFSDFASPRSTEGRQGRAETYSAKIYTTALLVITFFVAFVGPFNEYVQARHHRRHAPSIAPSAPFFSAGRWVGAVLILSFIIYLAFITLGIYRGVLVAPEGSDSGTDSTGDNEDTTDTEEEDAEEDDTTFEYRVEAGRRELRRIRNAERAREWTSTYSSAPFAITYKQASPKARRTPRSSLPSVVSPVGNPPSKSSIASLCPPFSSPSRDTCSRAPPPPSPLKPTCPTRPSA